MRSSTRLWFAVAIALAGIGLGINAWLQTRQTRPTLQSQRQPSVVMPVKQDAATAAEQQHNSITTSVSAAPAELFGGAVRRDQYQQSLEQVLAAYRMERVEDVAAALQRTGIEPSSYLLENPEFSQSTWDERRPGLMLAELEPVGAFRRISPDGPTLKEEAGFKNTISTRDAGRPFLEHVNQTKLLRVETVLTGQFMSELGNPFEGNIGLEFTWNPIDKIWVLTAFRAYHIPTNVRFGGPIL